MLIRRATSAVAGVRPATTKTAAGARRSGAARGFGPSQGHQRVARARAHLGGPTGGAGVAGVRRNGAQGGGRSSGGCGVSAAACKRASCHASVAPRVVASATDARAGPFGHRGFAGDESVRRSVSAPVEGAARARNRAWVRGKRSRDSRGSCREGQRARGSDDGCELTVKILGGRRWKR